MKEFDIETWKRKQQYNFFKNYEDPFFGFTVNIDVTNLYIFCKKHNLSFSLACVFVALKSINKIEEFKLRIKNGKVFLFDTVNIGSTVLNDDETFLFCKFPYKRSIFDFDSDGKKIIKAQKEAEKFDAKEEELNIIHCSTIPWISFTAAKNPRKGDEQGKGIPKIMFGGLFSENNKKMIPFSVEVHHALMDGIHIAKLHNKMQEIINELV